MNSTVTDYYIKRFEEGLSEDLPGAVDRVSHLLERLGPDPFGLKPSSATLEFLDKDKNPTNSVDFGLWDNAFGPTNNLLNDPASAEPDIFVGADSRRFFIRLVDKSAVGKGKLSVDWWTEKDPTPGTSIPLPVDMPPANSVTCIETPSASGTFLSPSLMLVTDPFDLDHASTPSGLGDGKTFTRGTNGYRMRLGSMFGNIVAEYRAGGTSVTAKANVFGRSPEVRRQLPLQIFILRGLASVPALSTIFNIDLPFIRLVYERIGLFAFTAVNPATPADDRRKGGFDDTVVLVDPPAGFSVFTGLTKDQARELATSNPGLSSSGIPVPMADTIRIFYVGLLNPLTDNGVYYGDGGVFDGAVFVANITSATSTSAAAHEMGHALNLNHFNPPPPLGRYQEKQNLMVQGADMSTFGTVAYPGRLWQIPGGDGSQNQYDTIRKSKFTRPG